MKQNVSFQLRTALGTFAALRIHPHLQQAYYILLQYCFHSWSVLLHNQVFLHPTESTLLPLHFNRIYYIMRYLYTHPFFKKITKHKKLICLIFSLSILIPRNSENLKFVKPVLRSRFLTKLSRFFKKPFHIKDRKLKNFEKNMWR